MILESSRLLSNRLLLPAALTAAAAGVVGLAYAVCACAFGGIAAVACPVDGNDTCPAG